MSLAKYADGDILKYFWVKNIFYSYYTGVRTKYGTTDTPLYKQIKKL